MKVTFDTNVFGPIVSPDDYPGNLNLRDCSEIARNISSGKIQPYISEASLSFEALKQDDRIDKFIREWALKTKDIELPQPEAVRISIIEKAISAGFRIMHVPRIALGAFVEIPDASWAPDEVIPQEERQNRQSVFNQAYKDKGLSELKQLGAELVLLHKIDTRDVPYVPGWPKPEQLIYKKGIIAEYDNPKKYPTTKKFRNVVRDIIAEWSDIDILGSHYGYGHDYFCTADDSKNTGTSGILHPSNRGHLKTSYGINVVSPSELNKLI